MLTDAKISISTGGRVRYLSSYASAMHCRAMDNIFIERLWRSLKQEAVYLHELRDGFQAKRMIDNWIESYNVERPHTAPNKRTPDDAYFDPIQIEPSGMKPDPDAS